jgi:transposase-like protein
MPCATQNELDLDDAKKLVANGCAYVVEGANMPTTTEATTFLIENGVYFAPGKAANAGGVAVSGLEMSQNHEHLSWSFDEVDEKLKGIMNSIYSAAASAAREYGHEGNLVFGGLPFLGHGNRSPRDGGLSMSIGLRCRHDRSVRELAAGMFGEGRGYKSVAGSLGIPAEAVRKWQQTYRATGRDGLLKMGEKRSRCDFETKVAAARAVVDGGMAKPEAMGRFGIASATPLKQWCRLYRGGGAEALRPRPRGRPRGSGAKAAPTTREQELEREVRRLEAQVAYLKKSMALKAELRSRTGRRP